MNYGPDQQADEEPTLVKLSRRDVQDARRLLTVLLNGDADAAFAGRTLPGVSVDSNSLDRRAREIFARRQRRINHFGKAMFGEPAWEMVLLLYMTNTGPRLTVSRLAELSGASRSTALRWIDYLEDRELVRREAHPTDKRAAFVELSAKGRRMLDTYLSEAAQSEG